ncbi:MAG TPA: helix-turn-helix transcriptional regulator [Thermoanaerobaculia bacterium]|jgi:AraC-like DNA-binding protein
MTYREIAPTAALRPWVECFWMRDANVSAPQRVLPDGCADIIFSEDEAFVVGAMTTAIVVPPAPGRRYFGVRFRPGRAAAFLGVPMGELTDARVPLRDLWRDVPRVETLESELLRRLDPSRDARVDAAIARLARGARVEDVARELGITRQHLARQFRHHVGLTPKTFARVMRFRRMTSAIDHDIDWADLAVRHGYYDQAHLIADFRALAGTTPSAFHFSNP